MQKQVREFISRPIGGDFGISVELPTLQDVVDYEQERIVLTHGYPRFVPHTSVTDKERLARISTGMPFALAFPSLRQAHFILNDYIQRYCPRRGFFALEANALRYMNSLHPGRKSHRLVGDTQNLILVEVDGVTIACLKHKRDYDRLRKLRRAWGSAFDVHRLSKVALPAPDDLEATLERTLCALEGARAKGSLFFQSGMSAVSAMVLLAVHQQRRLVLLGNAYVDTDTIGSSWPEEIDAFTCVRLPDDVDRDVLDAELQKGPALVYFEMPTNPNLMIVDLPMVAELVRRHDALIAVDATIITPYNIRPLDHGADLVIHSTSKFLSGGLNHLGGVITASSADLLSVLRDICAALDISMCRNQMAVLLKNLSGFASRMAVINENARIIAERLATSPAVGQVFYPGRASETQEALAKALFQPGRSGLVSFLLADNRLEQVAAFYDNIASPVMKGPGLGGEISLLCPYVMLAHYNDEKAVLNQKGLDFHLIRLSVGVEPVDQIWQSLCLS